jgi:hypothetical protein
MSFRLVIPDACSSAMSGVNQNGLELTGQSISKGCLRVNWTRDVPAPLFLRPRDVRVDAGAGRPGP